MNLSGILSILLITSSSVLCRRISHQDLEDVAKTESKMREENIQNTSHNWELESIEVTTPRAEILAENAAVVPRFKPPSNSSSDNQDKFDNRVSKKRIQKMLKKAILQIITGDLTTADMALLKSLNYDAEQVRKIREEEFKKKKITQDIIEKKNTRNQQKLNIERDLEDISAESQPEGKYGYDYEAFNNQATLDYEYAASNFEATNGSWDDTLAEYDDRMKSSTESFPEDGGPLRQQVVFRIQYNDSEFDSSSEENSRLFGEDNYQTMMNGTGNNFPASVTSANSSPAPVDGDWIDRSEIMNFTKNYFSTTENTIEENNEVDSQTIPSRNRNEDLKFMVNSTQQPEGDVSRKTVEEPFDGKENPQEVLPQVAIRSSTTETPKLTSNFSSGENRTKYKGLRWIQDNVYQVIPEYIDSLQTDMANETSDSSDDDASYQNLDDAVIKTSTITEDGPAEGTTNDAPDSTQLLNSDANISMENFANLTAYHEMITNRRQTLKQKTEDDIKSKVLMVTGRLNSSSNSNPLQPRAERLAMFSPSCGIPRNTDAELWQDPDSMNMQFQLNLTFDQHLVVARLRLYILPQENSTAVTSAIVDGVENDEKKIRISVYYYTRSLKKHRAPRKRLIDSKVTSLTSTGKHLALDVKDAARHWRSSTRNTNHGLLVLVEDQEGRPLQPSNYIQTPNCQNVTDPSLQDEKAYQRVPALFIRACTRYVRLVGNKMITYEFCGTKPEEVSDQEETNEY